MIAHLAFERVDQGPILGVDGLASEVIVVLRDLRRRWRGMFRPPVTFSRNGSTSSMTQGPPKERTRSASYAHGASS